MLTKLKEKVQAFLATEATVAHRIGLMPDAITVTGLVLSFLAAFSYSEWQNNVFFLLLAAVLLLFSGFCDALDGVVARLFHQTTVFGGFLDSLLDRYADAVVYAGIIIGRLCDTVWGLAALAGSLVVSYSRARAGAAGIRMESVGFAERAERIIILVVASVVAFFWEPFAVMNAAIVLLAVLSNLTVLQRGVYVYKRTREKGEQPAN